MTKKEKIKEFWSNNKKQIIANTCVVFGAGVVAGVTISLMGQTPYGKSLKLFSELKGFGKDRVTGATIFDNIIDAQKSARHAYVFGSGDLEYVSVDDLANATTKSLVGMDVNPDEVMIKGMVLFTNFKDE